MNFFFYCSNVGKESDMRAQILYLFKFIWCLCVLYRCVWDIYLQIYDKIMKISHIVFSSNLTQPHVRVPLALLHTKCYTSTTTCIFVKSERYGYNSLPLKFRSKWWIIDVLARCSDTLLRLLSPLAHWYSVNRSSVAARWTLCNVLSIFAEISFKRRFPWHECNIE